MIGECRRGSICRWVGSWRGPWAVSLICGFGIADRGALHKAVSLDNDVHIIEETQLFQDSEPIQTLLLSSKKVK